MVFDIEILCLNNYVTEAAYQLCLNEVYIAYLNQVNTGAAYEFVEH